MATELFPLQDPIRQLIYLPDHKLHLTVVGVMKDRENRPEFNGQLPAHDYSVEVYVPITTMREQLGKFGTVQGDQADQELQFEFTQATVKIANVKDVKNTANLIRSTLNRDYSNRDDISVFVPIEQIEKASFFR